MAYEIQLRRDTAANWTAADPVLATGEPGYETDTQKLKLGDGATAWTSLPYLTDGSVSPLTTKGDLWGFDTADDRIPVGADGEVLVADSSQPLGIAWQSSGGASNDTTIYVDAPTGDAATDNAALTAAIAACPAGGVVQMQEGTYALIDATTTTALAISKNLTLRGKGGSNITWASYGTRLTVDHATASGISISSHNVRLEAFAIQNTHATAPTAGAGIETLTGGGNHTHYGPDLAVRGFYENIDHQAGSEPIFDPSLISVDFVDCGLRLQNVDSTDGGDATVSGNYFAGPVNNGQAGIRWLSGGGFKGYALKVNTYGSVTLYVGIEFQLQDGVTTSDILLTGASIENVSYGVSVHHHGPSNTGKLSNILITGCQIANFVAHTAIGITPAATGKVSAVNVMGCVLSNALYGLQFANLDNASHGPNVYHNNSTANYYDGGGNTNITTVGNG